MNWIDIVLGVFLIYAAYDGFRNGILSQVAGILGLIIGAGLAFKYCGNIGKLIGLEGSLSDIVGFIIVLIIVAVLVVLIGRVVKGFVKLVGLGAMDSVGGVILGLFKMSLFLALILMLLAVLKVGSSPEAKAKQEKSVVLRTIRGIGNATFPYLDGFKKQIIKQID